jgi:ubiquinone/menaquinone biosynthesis C-methylase UbiE
MNEDRQAEEIRAHWSKQAEEFGEDPLATTPDGILRELEIQAISRRIPSQADLLDVGCGNGFSTLRFAQGRKGSTIGADYSEEMIEAARSALARSPVAEQVEFRVADVLALPFEDSSFDTVTTDRCLINLTSEAAQLKAISEIHRVLRPGGTYLMCENSAQGLSKLNELRKIVDLPEITTRWHNIYLDESSVLASIEGLFDLEEIDNFSSFYSVASRILNGKLAGMAGEEPRYDHPINQIAALLPSFGDYGPLKLFVLAKKVSP